MARALCAAALAATLGTAACAGGSGARTRTHASGSGLDLDSLAIGAGPGPDQQRDAAADPTGDVAIAPPPDQFDAAPADPAPPPDALRQDPFAGVTPSGGIWAVMIGIDDYPGGGHDLRSAVNDAADVNEALARLGVPGEHRLLITNTQASASIVRLGADWLSAHAGPDAIAVFFYAGHVRKLASTTEAIVAADGNLVTDDDLAHHLAGLRAGRTWIGIAACYGGGFTELLGPGRVLSAAAGANSLAYENEGFRRSYMVEYMIRQALIEGRSQPTVQDAFAYARATIHRDYPGREPVELDDGAPVIQLGPTAASVRPPPPPPPSQQSRPPSGGSSPPPTTTTTAPKPDGCKNLTLGVVSCK